MAAGTLTTTTTDLLTPYKVLLRLLSLAEPDRFWGGKRSCPDRFPPQKRSGSARLRLLGLLDLVECQHKDVCLDLKGATLQMCGGPQIRGYCKRAEVIVNCN